MNYYMFSSFSFLDLSVAAFNDLVSSGAGGILILIPSSENLLKISEEKKEIINALQDHLHTTEFEIPVYFSEESEQLLELLESLGGEAHTDKKSTSAASGENNFLLFLTKFLLYLMILPECTSKLCQKIGKAIKERPFNLLACFYSNHTILLFQICFQAWSSMVIKWSPQVQLCQKQFLILNPFPSSLF